MKLFTKSSLFLVLFLLLACARTVPLRTPNIPVQAKSAAQVEKAIKTVLHKRHWILLGQKGNTIQAQYNKGGKHSAVVEIEYTSSNVKINLVRSNNMLEGVGKSGERVIHKNYDGWLFNLENDIQFELSHF